MRLQRGDVWPLVIMLSGLLLGLAVLAGLAGLPRVILTFWFLLVCPGMAIVQLVPVEEGPARWSMAIALSLVLDTLVAETMALARVWSMPAALGVLIVVSLLGSLVQLGRMHAPASGPRRPGTGRREPDAGNRATGV